MAHDISLYTYSVCLRVDTAHGWAYIYEGMLPKFGLALCMPTSTPRVPGIAHGWDYMSERPTGRGHTSLVDAGSMEGTHGRSDQKICITRKWESTLKSGSGPNTTFSDH